jgi:hypothetical protein
MNLDFENMTWTCMICGAERLDGKIDVAYRPIKGLENQFPQARMNVRYCNDNYDCIAQAHGPGPWPQEAPNDRSSTG